MDSLSMNEQSGSNSRRAHSLVRASRSFAVVSLVIGLVAMLLLAVVAISFVTGDVVKAVVVGHRQTGTGRHRYSVPMVEFSDPRNNTRIQKTVVAVFGNRKYPKGEIVKCVYCPWISQDVFLYTFMDTWALPLVAAISAILIYALSRVLLRFARNIADQHAQSDIALTSGRPSEMG